MDEPKKDEDSTSSKSDAGLKRQISEEALQEREQRAIVYTAPAGVSVSTDTRDDPLPPRKRKKRVPPAVPARKRVKGFENQTDADSVKSAPRSQRSVRSASTELPSSSRSSRREVRSLRTRSLDRDSLSSYSDDLEKEDNKYGRKGAQRNVDYDTIEVLRESRSEAEKDVESGPSGSSSFHWRMSREDLSIEDMDGCLAGITGFIVTALSMGLLIMISWFIISQMDFILMVVTWTAKSLEESMMIFGGPTKEPQDDGRLSPELPENGIP